MQVDLSVRGSRHGLKYSLFYGLQGKRLIGCDKEAGKSDHRHYEDREEAYAFTTVDSWLPTSWPMCGDCEETSHGG